MPHTAIALIRTPPMRLAFFIFSYPLGISEIIIQSILGFARAGCFVDVFIDQDSFDRSPIVFDDPAISLCRLELRDTTETSLAGELLQLPGLANFLRQNSRFPRYPLFLKQALLRCRKHDYQCLIGIEPFGLIAAALCRRGDDTPPLIYYNLELYDRTDCLSEDAHRLKDLEIEATRQCLFAVLPDRNRARHFTGSSGISDEKIRLLTISTSGPPLIDKGDFFRKKFNIPLGKKIVLYAGHFAEWACCRDIVLASNTWPKEYQLVMHTWRMDMEQDDYCRELQAAAGTNVNFSLEPIPHGEFPGALTSADVGLMFYDPVDANFRETGSSSNKLALYLRAGLPVIASDLPSIREIFDRYHCGLCVSAPRDIAAALADIFTRYEGFRQNAHAAYRNHYNFEKNFAPLRDEIILNMAGGRRNSPGTPGLQIDPRKTPRSDQTESLP